MKLFFHFRFLIISIAIFYSSNTIFAQISDSFDPHPTSRVGTGIGSSTFGNYLEFQYRPYSHDLLNSDRGYIPFSESGKLNTAIRYYQDSNKLEISKFSILKLTSLTPFNSLTDSKSYGMDIGLESVTIENRQRNIDFNKETKNRITPLNGDFLVGYTFDNYVGMNKSPLVFSFLAGLKTQVHPQFNDFHRTGPQAVFNMLYDLGSFKIQFVSSYQYYVIFRNQNDFLNSLKIRYSIHTKQELRIELSKMRNDEEITLSYIYMF